MQVGFIGAGNMGSAIMRCVFQEGFLQAYETYVYDINEAQIARIKELYPVRVAVDNIQIARDCDYIVLAVKPAFMRGVLEDIRKFARNKRIISIAAGWTMGMLTDMLGRDSSTQVLRVMPNTPAMIGAGYTALCEETTFNRASLKWAVEMFSSMGMVKVLPERLFDAVVAVSGSSPAYAYMLIEAMADGAVKLGMPRATAIQAAAQAVMGSAMMVLKTGEHPAQLKDNVCSPGGTTIEAVEALEKGGMRGAILAAMEACAVKNRKLSLAAANEIEKRLR